MTISRKTDVTSMGSIDPEKGSDFISNPQLKVPKSISDTPGEKASNSPAVHSISKGQPFGKGGSGLGGK